MLVRISIQSPGADKFSQLSWSQTACIVHCEGSSAMRLYCLTRRRLLDGSFNVFFKFTRRFVAMCAVTSSRQGTVSPCLASRPLAATTCCVVLLGCHTMAYTAVPTPCVLASPKVCNSKLSVGSTRSTVAPVGRVCSQFFTFSASCLVSSVS